jgi:hypothetical protein
MTRRKLVGSVALAVLAVAAVWPVEVAAAEAGTVSFREVRRACSLRKVGAALARQSAASVGIDPSLAELRVAWAYQAEEPVETILGRLAELTDSRLTASTRASGRRRYSLERPLASANLAAWWRRESLRRSVGELLRAVEQEEKGKLEIGSFSSGMQHYLKIGRTRQMKLLRQVTGEAMDRLLSGERVKLPADALPDAELYEILSKEFGPNDPEYSADQVQGMVVRSMEATRKNGLSMQIDFKRQFSRFHLMLWFGGSSGHVLSSFGDAELGLPATRTNPYRLLETGVRETPEPELPMAFHERLKEEVAVPGGARWETALRELARVTGLDMTGDAYLCRYPSALLPGEGKRVVLAPQGASVAEALDQVCQKFGYLWWQKDGQVYLRARAWPWDELHEAPDRFVDQWSAALARGRPIGTAEIEVLASLTREQRVGLRHLGGSPSLNEGGLERPAAGEFLKLFQACTLAQRQQVMGPGLVIGEGQAERTTELLQPFSSRGGKGPVRLRLGQKVTANPKATPPTWRVELTLSRQWKEETSEMPLVIDVPMLGEVFGTEAKEDLR